MTQITARDVAHLRWSQLHRTAPGTPDEQRAYTHLSDIEVNPEAASTVVAHICDGCQTELIPSAGYCARCRPITRTHQGTGRLASGLLLILLSAGITTSGTPGLVMTLCGLGFGLILLLWGAARVDGVTSADLLRRAELTLQRLELHA